MSLESSTLTEKVVNPPPPPAILGPDGLTNKQRRKAKQAEKARLKEEGANRKTQQDPMEEDGEEKNSNKRKRSSDLEATNNQSNLLPHPSRLDRIVTTTSSSSAAGGDQASQVQTQEKIEQGEEEPMSHKKRRMLKKLAKASSSKGEEGEHQGGSGGVGGWKTSSVGGSNQIPVRSRHSVWVGNLSFSTDEAKLKDWFERRGVEGISRVHMPKGLRRNESNRGFAYVDLPSEEVVKSAIQLSENPLDGRKLLIKSGSDYTGRPEIDPTNLAALTGMVVTDQKPRSARRDDADEDEEGEEGEDQGASSLAGLGKKGKTGLTKTAQKILRSQKHPPGPTLFVGNLSFQSTEEGIRELLENSARRRDEWSKGGTGVEKKKSKKERKGGEKRKSEKGDEDSEAQESDSDDDDEERGKRKEKEGREESDSDSESNSDSESDSDSEAEEDGSQAKKEERKKGGEKQGTIRGAGIRKVRMGTFEDTGKCKGFAFIDFHTPAHATRTLIDPRNSYLDGRKLILQFAGADAVRRGAPKGSAAASSQHSKFKGGASRNEFGFGSKRQPPYPRSKPQEEEGGGGGQDLERPRSTDAPAPGSFDPNAPLPKKHKETQEERRARRAMVNGGSDPRQRQRGSADVRPPRREKPGAALANAKRESLGIVASQGNKISFD